MMQLGFVSAILPDVDFSDVMKFAGQVGYSCVEVCCWPVSKAERRYSGITHIDVSDFSAAQADDVRSVVEESGVAISGLGYYPNPLAPNVEESETAIAHIRKVIEASALLGINRMNTFVGRDWKLSVDHNWPRFLDIWKPLIKHAEDHGVKVSIENCPMSFTADEWPGGKNLATTPAIWSRMFSDIPSDSFGLNYDPSHDLAAHGLPGSDARLRRQAVSRSRQRRPHRPAQARPVGIMAHRRVPHRSCPAWGAVDWGQFCSVLTDTGYTGPVCVEVEDRAYEGSLENRQASLIQSHTFLRNFIVG